MKYALLTLFLMVWQPVFAGTESGSGQSSSCVDDSGNPKTGNRCVCYMKKTVCSDGVSTCAEQVCEQVACKVDADCASVSGKCSDGFCKR